LEASRRDWQQLSAAHQQLNFTLTQVQQEAENHTLEENADVHEIERLTLLQNIADMHSRWRRPRYRWQPCRL
jgi:hypothetical protein